MVVKRCLALLFPALLFGALVGCGADAPASTGGVSVPMGRCGRGLVAVESDYQSTNVSLLATDGAVLSSSFISSSGEGALSAPLSGDVVAPTSPLFGNEVVLVDRYPAAVLTFVNLDDAVVRAQLNVSTGFSSNPQDYLELAPDRAYVSRYDANPAPDRQPFDRGSDVLRIDPRAPSIVARIDLTSAMSDAPGFLPRPSRMLARGARLYVLLAAYDARFTDSAPSRLVVLEDDAITGVAVLDGLHGCNALASRGNLVAVGCSGKFDGATSTLAEAGVALLDIDTLTETARFAASDLVDQPLGFSLDFAADDKLLLTAFGSLSPETSDVAFELDTATGAVRRLVEAPAFALGEVRCMSVVSEREGALGCGACYIADAALGILHGMTPDGIYTIEPDTTIGLPPRYLGRF
jgi:hypothetical protein